MAESRKIRVYAILPVEVTNARQVIKLDRKLAAHLMICKGIHATVKGFLNTPSNIQHMGEISLLFNSLQVHPFHHTVGYNKAVLSQKNLFFPLNKELVPNSRIQGFYSDAGNSRDALGNFLPYTVNIYLHCKTKL